MWDVSWFNRLLKQRFNNFLNGFLMCLRLIWLRNQAPSLLIWLDAEEEPDSEIEMPL